MYKIKNITSEYHQEFNFSFSFGDVLFKLYYSDNLLGWFFSIEYEDLIINNMRLTNFPNILNQFNLVIPFGLTCKTKNGYDAVSRFDFEKGNATLYFLDKQEVNDVLNYDLRRMYDW